MATLLSLLQDVCDFGGFPRPTSIINSSDATARQLLAIANERGAEAVRMFDWPQLTKLSSLTLVAGTTQTLPADCAELLDQTAWYTGDMTPLRGPITPQEWQRLTQTGNAGLKFAFRMTQNSTLKRAVGMHPTPTGNEVISIFYRSKTWIKPRDYTPGMTVTTGMWCFSDGEYWTANGNGTAGATAPTVANNGATSPVAWTLKQNVLYERFTADSDEPLIESSVLMKGILARFYRMKGLEYQDLEAEFYSGLRNDLAERNGGRTDNLFRGRCGFLDTACADVGFIGGGGGTPPEPPTPTFGAIWGWGCWDPYSGQTQVLPSAQGAPTQLIEGNWSKVAAGWDVAVAIKQDGSLWAWGNGVALGKGLSQPSTIIPVEVATGTTWKSVDCAYAYTVAVKSDGTLWEWGAKHGGGYHNNGFPSQVGSEADWEIAITGPVSSFAKKTNGTWWAWNLGNWGSLGLGYFTGYTAIPVQVPFSTSWDKVITNTASTIVIKKDKSLWGCGANGYYQLGLNNTSNQPAIQQIADGEWIACTVGIGSGHGIKADGTLWAWGQNNANIGNNVNNGAVYLTTPSQVGTDTDWKNVWSNVYWGGGFFDNPWNTHTLLQKNDGSLYACGFNNTILGTAPGGSLGTNDGATKLVPTKISDPKSWVDITLGHYYGLAIVGAS